MYYGKINCDQLLKVTIHIIYCQIEGYDSRNRDPFNSKFTKATERELFIFGLAFYYCTWTWFTESYKIKCHDNTVAIIKKMWRKNYAIACLSWHLENPYCPTGFNNFIRCRYRYGVHNYSSELRYVVRKY